MPLVEPWPFDYSGERETDSFKLPPAVIYRYLTIERAKEIIETKKLWFSKPSDFNDPFDMYDDLVDFSMTPQHAQDFVDRTRPWYSYQEREEAITKLITNKAEFVDHQRKVFNKHKMASGVCCFSQSSAISLMWSHYADKHKGIVIGFNINPVRRNPLLMVQPVRYIHKVETKNYHSDQEEIVSHWIFTKSAIWEYEKEIRAFSFQQNGLIDFDSKCVKEVYFGCNTSTNDINAVLVLLSSNGYKNVSVKQMKINRGTFDIVATEIQK